MNSKIKKISSYFLIAIVLVTTLIAILEIWGLGLGIDKVFKKLIESLIVVFCSSAVVLFVFAVVLKEKE
ncbi:MAG: hypothetical protein CL846_10135 [Crocinitomicaceae bacterium]|nr:hypothetical protein [Crocinitomicaceae bacterium]|tara:strand:- start:5370 stop:5576 length:207 start_codon:yes stop_codon:yes gene_type:complete